MDLVLDTHVLLWSILGDPRLSDRVRSALSDSDNTLFLSMASLWEMGTKLAQGRLQLPQNDLDFVLESMRQYRIELLPVTLDHIRAASRLPFHHGDPFDRMLVAQAQLEGYRLVSADGKVRQYAVDLFW